MNDKWLLADSDKTFIYELNERGVNRFSAHVQDAHTSREELENIARLMVNSPKMLDALECLISAAMFGDEDEMDAMIRQAHIVVAEVKGITE